jgi:hypothetical protein
MKQISDKRAAAKELEALFLKYLTQSSETQDMRRKEFNQAIFDAEEGFACYNGTDLDMVMAKFDRALKEWCSK